MLSFPGFRGYSTVKCHFNLHMPHFHILFIQIHALFPEKLTEMLRNLRKDGSSCFIQIHTKSEWGLFLTKNHPPSKFDPYLFNSLNVIYPTNQPTTHPPDCPTTRPTHQPLSVMWAVSSWQTSWWISFDKMVCRNFTIMWAPSLITLFSCEAETASVGRRGGAGGALWLDGRRGTTVHL